ncbi:MAG: NADH-quinone oxidoreductase subunit M [Pirellulales bacterium]
MNGLLPMLVLLPLIGGGVLLFFASRDSDVLPARRAALALAGITLILSLVLSGDALRRMSRMVIPSEDQIVAPVISFQPPWLQVSLNGSQSLQLALGVDGLGIAMVLLTTIITFAVLLFASQSVTDRFSQYAGWTLLAESGLLLVFASMDVLSFYIGFELALLPLLALIGGWGSGDSIAAAKRFVLYTLAGSIPMIVGIVGIVLKYSGDAGPTVLFADLSQRAVAALPTETVGAQVCIFALIVFGLGIKMALLPLHTWLPTTYVSSHPTTAALLAAVVLKLGLFGFLRIALPLLPVATAEYGPSVLGVLGTAAIVYGALLALSQTDLRLLLAYSSLSHVGFITLGLFALNEEGIAGGALQMFNHGITTGAMFLLAGCIIARRGTADLEKGAKGIASTYPRLALLFVFFTIAGAGMPCLNNFVGELMTLTGMFARNPLLAAVGTLGVVFGAWYSLRVVRDILFGELVEPKQQHLTSKCDLTPSEWAPAACLAALCIFIGVYPQYTLSILSRDTNRIAHVYGQPAASSAADGQVSENAAAASSSAVVDSPVVAQISR